MCMGVSSDCCFSACHLITKSRLGPAESQDKDDADTKAEVVVICLGASCVGSDIVL